MGLGTYLVDPGKKSFALVHRTQPWYQAYMEALFEHDTFRISSAVNTAVEKIGQRQRELLVGPRTALERR